MKNKFFYLLLFSIWAEPISAQSTYFSRYFTTDSCTGIGEGVIQLNSGNYLSCSGIYNVYENLFEKTLLVKSDINGKTLWKKMVSTDSIGLEAITMKQMNSNEFIIGGTAHVKSTNNFEFFNMTIDSDANVKWLKYYKGIEIYKNIVLRGLLITKKKEILSVGFADDSFYANYINSYVVKTDSNGNLIWAHFYGGPEFTDTRGSSIAETNYGYIIDGISNIKDKFQTYDGYIVGIDSSGNQLWQKLYGTYLNSEGYNSITRVEDGNYLLSGDRAGPYPSIPPRSAWLMEIDSIGDSLWQKLYGNDSLGEGECISTLMTDDSGFAIIGDDNYSRNNLRYGFIIKVDKNGDSLWKHDYHLSNDPYLDYFIGFQQTSDSGFIITGICNPGDTQSVWLLKLDKYGCDSIGCQSVTGIQPVSDPVRNSLLIFPNPFSGQTHINYSLQNNSENTYVKVFDLLGNLVYSKRISWVSGEIKFSNRELNGGIYICTLWENNKQILEKKMVMNK